MQAFKKFIAAINAPVAVQTKKILMLVEIKAQKYKVDGTYEGLVFPALNNWLEESKNESNLIDIKASDMRTEVSGLTQLYGATYSIEPKLSGIVNAADMEERAQDLLKNYRSFNSDEEHAIFGRGFAIEQFEQYLIYLAQWQKVLEDNAHVLPKFFQNTADNINLILTQLKKSPEPSSANTFLSYPFIATGSNKLDIDVYKNKFYNFFDREIDYPYANAYWYTQTIMDQAILHTNVTILVVGDDHRDELRDAFMSAGYQKESVVKALEADSNNNMILNYNVFISINEAFSMLPLYLKNSAINRGSFVDYYIAFIKKYQNNPNFTCQYCQRPSAKILKCSKCKARKYCSSICQKEDWSRHKLECK